MMIRLRTGRGRHEHRLRLHPGGHPLCRGRERGRHAGRLLARHDQRLRLAFAGLIGAVNIGGSGSSELSDRIRNGDVAVDLTRPVDVQASYLAADLGRAAFTFLPRGLPTVLVGALVVGLTLPSDPWPYLLGLVSVTLAVTISFLCGYAVNILGFWLVETRGVRSLYMVTSSFLAGLFVPVGLFPDWLATMALATPFPSILQVPIDIVSGHVVGTEALKTVAIQSFWVAVTCLAGRGLARAGRHRLEVQGG